MSALAGMPSRCSSRAPASPPQATPISALGGGETPGAASPRGQQVRQGLGESPTRTGGVPAIEPADQEVEANLFAEAWTDRPDDGGIGYGRTGSSSDMSDRKHRNASLGQQCEDPPDQHAPPLQCGSPGSDKVRACTTICCSVRLNSRTPLPSFPRKVRENRQSGGRLVRDFPRPAIRRKEPVPAARRRAIHVQRVAALRDRLAAA